jgi:hypothetical protein
MAFDAVKVSRKKKIPTVICDCGLSRSSISNAQAPIKITPITRGTSVSDKKTFFPGEDLFVDVFLFCLEVFFAITDSMHAIMLTARTICDASIIESNQTLVIYQAQNVRKIVNAPQVASFKRLSIDS